MPQWVRLTGVLGSMLGTCVTCHGVLECNHCGIVLHGDVMKLMTAGTLRDHNGQNVPYKLERDKEDAARWVCSIDPHQCDQFTAAGSGKNHGEAVRNARAWWKQYDTAQ